MININSIIRHYHRYHYKCKRLLHSQLYIHENIIDDNERNEHELHETFNEYYENKKKK